MDQSQATFEGWAVIELFGHQREIGFVSTEYFGDRAMFRVDVPGLPEREYELTRPDMASGRYVPKGSTVKRFAVAARRRLVSPGAVYAINPCTEEVARSQIEKSFSPPLMLVAMPPESALPASTASITSPSSSEDYYEPHMEPMDDEEDEEEEL